MIHLFRTNQLRLLLLIPIFNLSACNIFQSKEQQCLQSARLEFKDPDSIAVVENLGYRGPADDKNPNFFWLRYKAKNSYGAYASSNMACTYKNGAWLRDADSEASTIRALRIQYLEVAIAANKAALDTRLSLCNSPECKLVALKADASRAADEILGAATEMAKFRVYESTELLVTPEPLPVRRER